MKEETLFKIIAYAATGAAVIAFAALSVKVVVSVIVYIQKYL